MSQPGIFPHRIKIVIVTLILLALACNMPGAGTPPASAPQPTAFDPTKAALEFQATAMSQKMTEQALAAQNVPAAQTVAPTPQPTSAPPTEAAPTENRPTPTQDFEARMKSAKILVYEDTPYIGLWIKDTLQGMGLKHTFVGDAMGDFMENLNSGIKWDLVIIGAESHDYVSGDFFDVVTERVVKDKTALIVEMWYLDKVSEGRVKPLTTKCGVELQKNYDLASSIYWLESSSPVFTEPNIAPPLIHYDIYWEAQAGDYMRLLPGSEGTLLAGMYQNRDNDYGVIASCFDGRVILQTFCNHDYHQADIELLWENYIYTTLKNHFIAIDQ